MKFEQGKSEFPTGLAPQLESQKETLPAVEVKNHVVWVNPDLDLPFNLEEGKSANLAFFLSAGEQKKFFDFLRKKRSKDLEVGKNHGRSAILGRVVFGEKNKEQGGRQLFRDVDMKGSGFVDLDNSRHVVVRNITLRENGQDSYGILDLKDANKDSGISETFQEYGIRTHRVVGIVALDEILSHGKRISIADAKSQGLIAESSTPVLEIRAFGTSARLLDTEVNQNSDEKRGLLIEDARILVAQELGINPQEFSRADYAKWLARTVGKNLALMHKNGWIHKYLELGHNITLDGCFVDFDSTEHVDTEVENNFLKDYQDAQSALSRFFGQLKISTSGEIDKILEDEYKNSYDQYKH